VYVEVEVNIGDVIARDLTCALYCEERRNADKSYATDLLLQEPKGGLRLEGQ